MWFKWIMKVYTNKVHSEAKEKWKQNKNPYAYCFPERQKVDKIYICGIDE